MLSLKIIRQRRTVCKTFQIWHKSEGGGDKYIYLYLFYIKKLWKGMEKTKRNDGHGREWRIRQVRERGSKE